QRDLSAVEHREEERRQDQDDGGGRYHRRDEELIERRVQDDGEQPARDEDRGAQGGPGDPKTGGRQWTEGGRNGSARSGEGGGRGVSRARAARVLRPGGDPGLLLAASPFGEGPRHDGEDRRRPAVHE